MEIAKAYQPIWDDDTHYALLKSGRDAGKSTSLYQIIVHNFFKYPNLDIIVCRANISDIKKSVFEKVEQYRTPGTLISSNTS